MKKHLPFFLLFLVFSCETETDYFENIPKITTQKTIYQTGIATWYGPGFDGRKTSSGESFDMYCYTAAHLKLPLQTIIRVTNVDNNRVVVVRVNDRGPVNPKLVLDLSKIAATNLDIPRKGSGKIEIEVLAEADMNPMEKLFIIYRNMGNE